MTFFFTSSPRYSEEKGNKKSSIREGIEDSMRCVRDFNLHNQEISQSCNMLIIIKLLQINYITKYH